MNSKSGRPKAKHVISVSASAKKAGKSTLASYLVRELGVEYGLKVSSGGEHGPSGVISDPEVIETPGTDTGALVEAGAKCVVWVNVDPSMLADELNRALSLFPEEGTLVIEGNSALAHVEPDFAVFLMNSPFEDFKPSASIALEKADLVIVNLKGSLSGADLDELSHEISNRAPSARIIFNSENDLNHVFPEVARLARDAIA